MMERMVLDKLEARRMVLVGSCFCGLVPYFENDDDEEEEEEKKKTYHPPPPSPSTPIPTPIPTNHPHHRKNPIQHHNPH